MILMHAFFKLFLFPILFSDKAQPVDLIVYNAKIYTVDASFSTAEAMAVKEGRIVATGTTKSIRSAYAATKTYDAKGRFIYPGFIDAHAHFTGYGLGLQSADLVGTTSWHGVLKELQSFAETHKEGWLIGRGWDQNDWPVKEFPTNKALDSLFPGRPVFLERVDGHAAIANSNALALAGVKAGDAITGGTVETANGRLTGVLIDNAVNTVSAKIPSPTAAQLAKALQEAQQACFAVGLTTVSDCGVDYKTVLFMDSLQKQGSLQMRLYAMLSDAAENYQFAKQRGKLKTDFLNVRSFKVYADGALGSRGACLLQPYSDKPDWSGFLLSPPQHFDSVAQVINNLDFQICTHAIGDSGNRTVLQIYAKHLNGKNDKRWRIEHAQVVNSADFAMFGAYSIIPSVQPTHATSDMYWAGERLGKARERGAYAYKQLLQQNGWLPLGTDFPVENISPFKTFYAAVWRQDAKGFPQNGYHRENALMREEALRGITVWAARSQFEEGEKGSLEKGKFADFVVLDTDLIKAAPKTVIETKVLATFVGGRKQFEREYQP
jgi:predicted amidohydrolase YtcJ